MKKSYSSALCVVGAGCLWGLMGLLVRRLSAAGLSPMDICFIRALVSLAVMALCLLVFDRGAFRVRLRDLWCFLGTGVVSMVSFNYCYFRTMTLTSLSVAAVLLYTAPVFVMLLSAALFNEKLTRRKWLAALVAILGCACVSGVVGGAVKLSPAGLLCGLGAGLGYALYSVFSRYALNRGYSSATITLYTLLFAGVATLFIADVPATVAAVATDGGYFAVTALLIVTVTLLPYLLYNRGLQGMENGVASIVASIEPVIATLLGTLAFREELGIWNIIGMLLVLTSIFIINSKGKPAQN